MGFRFRKSINLGGGFKVNLSKSGIGYSWGGKGFSFTKKAKGGTRQTVSVPGTGISWTNDNKSIFTKKKKKVNNVDKVINHNIQSDAINEQNVTQYNNADIAHITSSNFNDLIKKANRAILTRKVSLILMVISFFIGFVNPMIFILTGISSTVFIVFSLFYRIDLEYDIDKEMKEEIDSRFKPLEQIISSEKLWRITESVENKDIKYSSGAKKSLKRKVCKAKTKIIYPFRTEEKAITIDAGKEKFIFLPDKLFIIQQSKVGAFSYDEITTHVSATRFLESESIPKDAKVIGKTWKYVNKNGGMDKRFKDNEEIPICMYGEMKISSPKGIDTLFMFSNTNIDI